MNYDKIYDIFKSYGITTNEGKGIFIKDADHKEHLLTPEKLTKIVLSENQISSINSPINITDWQIALLSAIKPLQPKAVYIFTDHTINHFWITISSPTTVKIHQYSSIYCEIVDQFPEMDCDFLVFGENEVTPNQLPPNAIIFIKNN